MWKKRDGEGVIAQGSWGRERDEGACGGYEKVNRVGTEKRWMETKKETK